MATIFPSHLNDDTTKYECAPASIALIVKGSELYFYNTEGDRNSVVSQTSCRMDVTRVEQQVYRGFWTLWDNTIMVNEYEYGIFKLLVRVVISEK